MIHNCIQCSKVCVRADTLEKQINICSKNSQQREKVCSLCNKVFVKVWHLQEHLKTHMQQKNKYQCGNCNKTYSKESFYRCHKKKCNGNTTTTTSANILKTY